MLAGSTLEHRIECRRTRPGFISRSFSRSVGLSVCLSACQAVFHNCLPPMSTMATQNFLQPVRVLHLLTACNSGRNPTDPAHKPEHQHEMKIVIHYSLRPHQAQTSLASSASACASASSIAAVSNTQLAAGAPAVADSKLRTLPQRPDQKASGRDGAGDELVWSAFPFRMRSFRF